MLKNVTPSGAAPPPIFANTVNYLISQSIMNKYRYDFQELFYRLGEEKWVNKMIKYVTPPPAAAPAVSTPNSKTHITLANYVQTSSQFPGITSPNTLTKY